MFLSSVSKLIEPKKGSLDCPIHSQLVKSTGDDMSLELAPEVEGGFVN